MSAPRVSICIVAYEAPDYLKRCLESISRNTSIPHETVIVDNASGPATRTMLEALSGAKVIYNSENRLWCPAMNQALRAASKTSPYLLLLNPDTEVLRLDWLDRMIASLAKPGIGLVGPFHNFRPISPTFGALDGSCLMVRRELLEDPAIGFLDEQLPWNGSPYVLTARAWRQGWGYRRLRSWPALILHHGGKSREEAPSAVLNHRIDHRGILEREGLNVHSPGPATLRLHRALIDLGRPLRPS